MESAWRRAWKGEIRSVWVVGWRGKRARKAGVEVLAYFRRSVAVRRWAREMQETGMLRMWIVVRWVWRAVWRVERMERVVAP